MLLAPLGESGAELHRGNAFLAVIGTVTERFWAHRKSMGGKMSRPFLRTRGVNCRRYIKLTQCCAEMEPGHGSPGQQFGSGSGRDTGQSPDPAF